MISSDVLDKKIVMSINKAAQLCDTLGMEKIGSRTLLASLITIDCWALESDIGGIEGREEAQESRGVVSEFSGCAPLLMLMLDIASMEKEHTLRNDITTMQRLSNGIQESLVDIIGDNINAKEQGLEEASEYIRFVDALFNNILHNEMKEGEYQNVNVTSALNYAGECLKWMCPKIFDNDMDKSDANELLIDEINAQFIYVSDSHKKFTQAREICLRRYAKMAMAANDEAKMSKDLMEIRYRDDRPDSEQGIVSSNGEENDREDNGHGPGQSGSITPIYDIRLIGDENGPKGLFVGIPGAVNIGRSAPGNGAGNGQRAGQNTSQERAKSNDSTFLGKFGTDMIKSVEKQREKNGGIRRTVFGRDKEVETVIETLGKRTKSNCCLVGEPGVGKTAIITGLAERMADGEVPEYLKEYKLFSVSSAKLVGGTSYRGQLEEKVYQIIEEAEKNKCILFFDEMHTVIGAGRASDSNIDVANILKDVMANGSVKIIGATTPKEYKAYISTDLAFERRVQRINIDELSVGDAIKVIADVMPLYSKHHNAEFTSEAIEEAVELSDRYITRRKLPDKAIDILDTTAARLRARGVRSSGVVIGAEDVRETICSIENLKLSDIGNGVKSKTLQSKLEKSVKGQSDAIKSVVKAVKRAEAGVRDPKKPIANFLFVGPTGVGKTELAKQLAIEIMGSEKKLIRMDMSEFMEEHSVSKMIGSPPGYVGYGEGGKLTEAVKRDGNSVILFDEIEKASKSVLNVLLQVMDDGVLTDSCGETISLKNCIIIMTSNTGFSVDMSSRTGSIGFGLSNGKSDKENKVLDEEVRATFKPEFLNRIDEVVRFSRLSKEDCAEIVKNLLKEVCDRMADKGITVEFDDSVYGKIIDVGYDEKYGARNIKRAIQTCVEDLIADEIISKGLENVHKVRLEMSENELKVAEN